MKIDATVYCVAWKWDYFSCPVVFVPKVWNLFDASNIEL